MAVSLLIWQWLGLMGPGLAVGALAAGLGKLVWWHEWRRRSWWSLAWPTSLAGALTAVGGMMITGHDGRMSTYAAMVLACASTLAWRAPSRAG